MTIAEILALVADEYGSRNQISPTQALTFLNEIQRIAFNRDLDAFLYYENFITINPEPNQKGPYSWASLAPQVRKMVGVTAVSDQILFGYNDQDSVPAQGFDYGMVQPSGDIRNRYERGVIDHFSKSFRFIREAPTTEPNTWRWVYYRRPDLILKKGDNAKLLIPEEFHYTLCVQGCIALADSTTFAEKVPERVLDPYLQPFWEKFTEVQNPNGDDIRSEGQP